MVRFCWKSVVCLAALALFCGCPGGDAGVDTVSVSGTVTLDGTPVEGASVAFSPKSADAQAAAAVTDASGRFTLASGAVPGSYTVTVSKTSGGGTATEDPRSRQGGQMSEADTKAMMELAQNGGDASAATDLLPVKYKSAADSDLTAEVKQGGENDFTFELTSN